MGRRSSKARKHPKARPQGVLDINPRGFGFVKTAEGEFFIPSSKLKGAFPGDLVEVARIGGSSPDKPALKGERPTACVTKVLMRGRDTLIGRYEVAEPFGIVIPEDPSIQHDIFTLRKDAPQVKDGDIVEVRIIEFPSRNSAATGKVVRVLGSEEDSDIAIDLIIAEHQLETEFSAAALEEASSAKLEPDLCLVRGYRDLRKDFIFTVDPVDARDFDDAVSLEWLDDGSLKLGVHIADVSQFVGFGSSVDLDARKRATSVYLADRVLPMIPEALSNGLCSLVPGQERAAISVEAVLTSQGSVVSYEVFPSIIRSSARLSYEQAQTLIDAARSGASLDAAWARFRSCEVPQGALPLDPAVVSKLQQRVVALCSLSQSLFASRKKNGCMDFDRVEAKVQLDASGNPVGINYRRRTDATQLIEEAMILANHLVAEWLTAKAMPCVYRVHDEPDGEALRHLYEVLQESPLFSDINKTQFCSGNPKTLQEVLGRVKGLPQQELVNSLLLRSMKRAVYRPELSAHYGVGLETYCHFTSPIRRYPDLLVHRMLKEVFFGHSATYEAQRNALPWLAEHSSAMEREAEKAARQSQLVKIVEYMGQFVGQTFEGVIAFVSTFGVRVRLECTASGMVPVEDLGDEYFAFDPVRYSLTGTSTGIRYQLGQRLKVVLVGAYPRERRLAFKLAEPNR